MTLLLEASPRNVALARMFVASAVHEAGLDEEAIDDVKIAVSEAVTYAMGRVSSDGHVLVRLSPEDGAVVCSVESIGHPTAPAEGDPAPTDIGAAIISALFLDASIDPVGAVAFTIPVPVPGSS